MGSILDFVDGKATVWGCDTETYSEPSYGLKSIQIWNPQEQHYFIHHDYLDSDVEVRRVICSKFFDWLNALHGTQIIAFFNMDFDFSQWLKEMVTNSPWAYKDKSEFGRVVPKGCFSILESDTTMYKCELHTETANITFMDLAKFLTSTTLDKATSQWLGIHKKDVATKRFPKAIPTEEEKQYAMWDAEITQMLAECLEQTGVLEGTKYVTIAGRTMGHFRDFLRKSYGLTFQEFAWGTKDKEAIEDWAFQWEKIFRRYTRGGICRAFKTGHFVNCHHIDAKSMYPSQMDLDYIPHGPPLYEPPKTKYTTIYFPKGYYVLRNDKVSGIQFRSKELCQRYAYKKVYEPAEYVESVYFDGTFPIWEAEYNIFNECFEPVGEVDDSKRIYVEMLHNTVLKTYIEELYQGKETNTGTKKYYYKILMNALYGKFLSRPDGVAITYMNGERKKVEETDRQTYYLPLGNWVAMMGRVSLMKCLLSIPKDNLLYCDTDSCIYIGNVEPNVKIGKNLGCWAIENDGFESWIVGPKTYQELNPDGTLITKCAGLSNDVRKTIPFMGLQEDQVFNVYKARRDPDTWAINIKPTEFKISTKASAFRNRS